MAFLLLLSNCFQIGRCIRLSLAPFVFGRSEQMCIHK